MTPHVTIHHYKFSDLRNFIEMGRKHGDVGLICLKETPTHSFFRGFGTIENPIFYPMRISIEKNKSFDGEKLSTFSFVLLDLSEENTNSNNAK